MSHKIENQNQGWSEKLQGEGKIKDIIVLNSPFQEIFLGQHWKEKSPFSTRMIIGKIRLLNEETKENLLMIPNYAVDDVLAMYSLWYYKESKNRQSWRSSGSNQRISWKFLCESMHSSQERKVSFEAMNKADYLNIVAFIVEGAAIL